MLNASPSNTSSLCNGRRYYLLIAVSIVVGALLALPLFIGSASAPTTLINQVAVKDKFDISTVTPHQNLQFLNFNFLAPVPQGGPVTVETYAADCTTPKNEYNVQDTDLTVCAKFTNALPGWRVIWSNARAIAVQTTIITSANGTATFTLNANSSLGDWRVIIFEPFGGTVQVVTPFTVIDQANPTADLLVSTGAISGSLRQAARHSSRFR